MKTEEDEAFDEIARRQGGGFPAKRAMAADKLQEPIYNITVFDNAHPKGIPLEDWVQPVQEPVAYPEGDVVGPCICGSWPGGKCLKCPRITAPPQRQWIWLSDADIAEVIDTTCQYTGSYEEFLIKKAEQKIKSMNT
jgi:hypothetical protein